MRFFLPLLLATSLVGAVDSPAPATAASTPAATPTPHAPGTIDLWNGKDLTGWSFVSNTTTDIASVCHIKDGVMSFDGKPPGYVEISGNRSNYKLHIEFLWPKDSPSNCNGGVLLNISSGPIQQDRWPTSYQIQTKTTRIGDILLMAGATIAETTPPVTSPTGSPTKDRMADSSEKPFGEWNNIDITCNGDTIEVAVNGVLQNRVTKCVPSTGKIGFQFEGFPFQLRNITLTPLKTPKPSTAQKRGSTTGLPPPA